MLVKFSDDDIVAAIEHYLDCEILKYAFKVNWVRREGKQFVAEIYDQRTGKPVKKSLIKAELDKQRGQVLG